MDCTYQIMVQSNHHSHLIHGAPQLADYAGEYLNHMRATPGDTLLICQTPSDLVSCANLSHALS